MSSAVLPALIPGAVAPESWRSKQKPQQLKKGIVPFQRKKAAAAAAGAPDARQPTITAVIGKAVAAKQGGWGGGTGEDADASEKGVVVGSSYPGQHDPGKAALENARAVVRRIEQQQRDGTPLGGTDTLEIVYPPGQRPLPHNREHLFRAVAEEGSQGSYGEQQQQHSLPWQAQLGTGAGMPFGGRSNQGRQPNGKSVASEGGDGDGDGNLDLKVVDTIMLDNSDDEGGGIAGPQGGKGKQQQGWQQQQRQQGLPQQQQQQQQSGSGGLMGMGLKIAVEIGKGIGKAFFSPLPKPNETRIGPSKFKAQQDATLMQQAKEERKAAHGTSQQQQRSRSRGAPAVQALMSQRGAALYNFGDEGQPAGVPPRGMQQDKAEFQQTRKDMAMKLGSEIGQEGDGEEYEDLVSDSDDEKDSGGGGSDPDDPEMLPVGVQGASKRAAGAGAEKQQLPSPPAVSGAAAAAAAAAGTGGRGSSGRGGSGKKRKGWPCAAVEEQQQGAFYVAGAEDDRPGLHLIQNYDSDSGNAGAAAAAGAAAGVAEEQGPGEGEANGSGGGTRGGRRKMSKPKRTLDPEQEQQQMPRRTSGRFLAPGPPPAAAAPNPLGVQSSQPGSQETATEKVDLMDSE